MSGLIKQTQAAIAVDRLPAVRPRAVEPPPRDPRLGILEARVKELEATLASERRAAERAIADARTAGRDEMVADDAKRLALVERGIAEALAAWRDRLAGIEGLAALLARAAVGKMFGNGNRNGNGNGNGNSDGDCDCDCYGNGADGGGLVARTLTHHVERIGARAVVSVAVSARDFGDEAALAAVAAGAGLSAAQLVARTELPAGACRVALRLGEVELDPATQWAVIEAALRAIGTEA